MTTTRMASLRRLRVVAIVAVLALATAACTSRPSHRAVAALDVAAVQDIYVSPSGSDQNRGTVDEPLRSIQRAADLAMPGIAVHVAPGDYAPVVTETNGTADRRITFESTDRWAARIGATGDSVPWRNSGSYVDIVGFDISGPGAHHGIIDEGSHVSLAANHVHDIFTDGACTGGAGINEENPDAVDDEITGNLVHDVGTEGCSLVHGIYVSNRGSRVQNNIVHRVAAWCIHTWHGANALTIANNLAFDCGAVGGGILIGAGDLPPDNYAENFVVTNNIVVDSEYGISEAGRVGAGNRYANNLLFRCRMPLSLWTEAGVTLTADPRFVNYRGDGTGDYHLQPSSPAVDGGTQIGAPARDYDSASRPTGTATDIGIYER